MANYEKVKAKSTNNQFKKLASLQQKIRLEQHLDWEIKAFKIKNWHNKIKKQNEKCFCEQYVKW